jgi:hypothetical protein
MSKTDRQLLQELRDEMVYEPSFNPYYENTEDGSNPDREHALGEAWANVWERIDRHLQENPEVAP